MTRNRKAYARAIARVRATKRDLTRAQARFNNATNAAGEAARRVVGST
jgi:hypothetical protein